MPASTTNCALKRIEVFFDLPRLPEKPLGMHIYAERVLASVLDMAPPHMDISLHAMGIRGMTVHAKRLRGLDATRRAQHIYTVMPGTVHNVLFDLYDILTPRHRNSDIVHSFGCRRIKTADSRLVVSIQDVIPIRLNEGTAQYVRQSERDLRWLVERASAVITISEFSKREISEVLNVDPALIHVIPNGVDRNRYCPIQEREAEAAKRRLSELGIQPPYIVHFGGAAERKNVRRLVASFAELKRRTKLPHQLLIGGQIPSRDLVDTIASSGVSEAVKCLGYLSNTDATLVLKLADLLVFPSTYEGFGLPPLEAMSCGVPVALSKAASLPEVGGEACVYFDPYALEEMTDAMEAVLTDASLRQRCVELGLEQSAKFCWRRNAQATLDVYARVLHSA